MTVDHNYFSSLHETLAWMEEGKQIFTISSTPSPSLGSGLFTLAFEMENFHVIALQEKQNLQTKTVYL